MAKLSLVVVAAIAALSIIALQGAEAATYFVGDTVAWRIPPNGAAAYTNWSSSYTFQVEDVLVFNFATGQHDVAHVTQANYNSCEDDSPIQLLTTGPANFTLNATGTYYFICTIGDHCESGQKVTVTVGSSSGSPSPTASPPPGNSTTTPSQSPPPGSSGAPSLAAASKVFLAPLAIVMGFMWI
ncbi:umecyanin-like [Punica granatum]|uniref:Phytocyanin domain-containing protein n=2 Tax=Punica granatum TaxID=22663 RepID=A0A218VZT6_PUNGR|nr:umecyanin-like [Punica granatum]OWM65926.1 hypothetical protein CDL15_Pgr015351 [Punica granatum]PKI79584.1 hypothetical protein CRG98_000059 [Punica granatum]